MALRLTSVARLHRSAKVDRLFEDAASEGRLHALGETEPDDRQPVRRPHPLDIGEAEREVELLSTAESGMR